MRSTRTPTRRGLTLVELMLSLGITLLIASAVATMLGAVTTGLQTRHDTRSHMLYANAAQIRLAAYIAPSLCILDASTTDLVLWFNDARGGETVHARELRWLKYDDDDGMLRMYRVQYPDDWTNTQVLVEESEYAADSDWDNVFRYHSMQGWLSNTPLVDGLDDLTMSLSDEVPQDSRHVNYMLSYDSSRAPTLVSATVQSHRRPK